MRSPPPDPVRTVTQLGSKLQAAMLSPYAGGQLEGLFYSLPSAKTLTTKQSELRDTRAALRSLMFYFIRDWHPQEPTSTCLQDLIPSCLTEGNGSSMLLLSSIAPVLPRSFPFSMHVALFSLSQFSLDSFHAPIHALFPFRARLLESCRYSLVPIPSLFFFHEPTPS